MEELFTSGEDTELKAIVQELCLGPSPLCNTLRIRTAQIRQAWQEYQTYIKEVLCTQQTITQVQHTHWTPKLDKHSTYTSHSALIHRTNVTL